MRQTFPADLAEHITVTNLEQAATEMVGTPVRAGQGGPVVGRIIEARVVDGALIVDCDIFEEEN